MSSEKSPKWGPSIFFFWGGGRTWDTLKGKKEGWDEAFVKNSKKL